MGVPFREALVVGVVLLFSGSTVYNGLHFSGHSCSLSITIHLSKTSVVWIGSELFVLGSFKVWSYIQYRREPGALRLTNSVK